MTTIYLIRNSEPDRKTILSRGLSRQTANEMQRLTPDGEELALMRSESLGDIDYVYSSSYERARDTANIISKDHRVPIIIYKEFNERLIGSKYYDKIPDDFEERQFYDENYKLESGESQVDVVARMKSGIDDILKRREDKTVAIVSHNTAILYYLKSCFSDKKNEGLTFYNEEQYDGKFCYCDAFKLSYEKDKLVGLEIMSRIEKEKSVYK